MIDNYKIWMFNRHFPSWKSHRSLGFGEKHQGETQSDGVREVGRRKEGLWSSGGADFGVHLRPKRSIWKRKGKRGLEDGDQGSTLIFFS